MNGIRAPVGDLVQLSVLSTVPFEDKEGSSPEEGPHLPLLDSQTGSGNSVFISPQSVVLYCTIARRD